MPTHSAQRKKKTGRVHGLPFVLLLNDMESYPYIYITIFSVQRNQRKTVSSDCF
jgi:hypothetical protein